MGGGSKKRTPPRHPNLPQDLIQDILSWLPTPSLLRLRSVSKSWNAITRDPTFIATHHARSSCFLFHAIDDTRRPPSVVLRLAEINTGHPQGVMEKTVHQIPTSTPFDSRRVILASCNSLLCLGDADTGNPTHLCNPVTGDHVPLPPPDNRDNWLVDGCGFGFASRRKEYKVVRIGGDPRVASICTIPVGRAPRPWRRCESVPRKPMVLCNPGVCVYGRLHWLKDAEKPRLHIASIISFDLEDEQFRKVPAYGLRSSDHSRLHPVSWYLAETRGCLSIMEGRLESGTLVLWTMTVYGVDSWTPVLSLPPPPPDRNLLLSPLFCLWKNERFLICTQEEVICYDPVARDWSVVLQMCGRKAYGSDRCTGIVFPFTSSMVRCVRQWRRYGVRHGRLKPSLLDCTLLLLR